MFLLSVAKFVIKRSKMQSPVHGLLAFCAINGIFDPVLKTRYSESFGVVSETKSCALLLTADVLLLQSELKGCPTVSG